jgi:Subtilase family
MKSVRFYLAAWLGLLVVGVCGIAGADQHRAERRALRGEGSASYISPSVASPRARASALSLGGDELDGAAAFAGLGGVPLGLTGRVLVVMDRDVDVEGLARAARAAGGALERWLSGPRVAILDSGAPALALALAEALKRVDGVISVEPDFIRPSRVRRELSDPRARTQWSAERTCLPAAFDLTMGRSEVVIAVIDDGFDLAHEDLGGFTADAWDFADDDGVPGAGPNDDHGTAVVGIAAARANNGRGITGYCPQCGVLLIRRGFTDADDASAIVLATDAGADIINCSWGYPNPSSAVIAALRYATVDGRRGRGAVVVFAAGNDGVDIDESHDIAATPGVLAVMATGPDDRLSSTSSTSARGLAAPAGGRWTTDRTSGGYAPGPYTEDFGGTSAAAPAVAGTAGLLLTVAPTLSREEVVALLRASADLVEGRTATSPAVPRLHAGRAVAQAAGATLTVDDPRSCSFTPEPPPPAADTGCAISIPRSGGEPGFALLQAMVLAMVLRGRRRACGARLASRHLRPRAGRLR